MEVTLKPAQATDRNFFVALHHKAYRSTIEQMFAWNKAEQDQFARAKFDEPGLYIAWLGENPIGSVGWDLQEGAISMREVYVVPSFQNRTIGTAMIAHVQAVARVAGRDVHLRTLRANLRAKALYERNGFCLVDHTDLHWHMVWKAS